MKIIVVMAEKGGVGKTTLATNLAALLPKSILVDVDPQKSATLWHTQRKDKVHPLLLDESSLLQHGVESVAESLSGKYEWMVIDTPGHLHAGVFKYLTASDICLVIAEPGLYSVGSLGQSINTAMTHAKQVMIVLNRTNREIETAETRQLIKQTGIEMLEVSQRVSFRRSASSGLTTMDLQDDIGAQEIEQLKSKIFEKLGVSHE